MGKKQRTREAGDGRERADRQGCWRDCPVRAGIAGELQGQSWPHAPGVGRGGQGVKG